ncbi:siderophore-interacting protein [Cellulomonas sp. GbtcB1]|uniref:siderophore-interacting protein n=1 Tax=Cellulomonas sp. GbtcB1 TaxID=2824746 RepID=UPI001C30B8A7|nr:siderophore-interacting protein [Cellulomonas sp. GbtcB1]
MARSSNINAGRRKPELTELLTLHVLRTERVSTGFVRVTLGGGDAARFRPMGYDQWFRLFIPVADDAVLSRLPNKLDTLAYLKYLAIARTERPVLRNYTVRAHRPDGPEGPELDVDFVLHGTPEDGTSGPAATWAQTCAPGDAVAILDEGITFPAATAHDRVLLVADETGLPAVAGILGSLGTGARGVAVVEVPHSDDVQDLAGPACVQVRWVVRDDPHAVAGPAALAAVEALPVPDEPVTAWVVGEQSLVAAARRHWVAAGVPKQDVTFCGYWRAAKARVAA